MAISALEASKNIFNEFFVSRDHFNRAKYQDSHLGKGATTKTYDIGFFRIATDCIFLVTLFDGLRKTNDPLAETVHQHAYDALQYMRVKMDEASPDPGSWANAPGGSPDTAYLAIAYSKAYDYMNVSSGVKSVYKNRADGAINSMVTTLYDEYVRVYGREFWNSPSALYGMDCGVHGSAPKSSVNIIANTAGALGMYAYHIYRHINANPSAFPHREKLMHFGYYVQNTKMDNNLWKVGGSRSGETPQLNGGCEMQINYDTWCMTGIGMAARGIDYTPFPNRPNSSFATTSEQGSQGLQALYNAKGYFPEVTDGGYYNVLNATNRAGYVSVVPVGNNSGTTQWVFNRALGGGGGYRNIALSDENGGIGGEANFHRLIHGLAGAIENNMYVDM